LQIVKELPKCNFNEAHRIIIEASGVTRAERFELGGEGAKGPTRRHQGRNQGFAKGGA